MYTQTADTQRDLGLLSGPPRPVGLPPATSPAIKRSEVLVVCKQSSFERELAKSDLDEEELKEQLISGDAGGARVVHSFTMQESAKELARQELTAEQVVSLDFLTEGRDLSQYKAVVVLGGDDFFKLVSHHLHEDVVVLGVRSDPVYSKGFLLPIDADQLPQALTRLETGAYTVEQWSQVKLVIDGVDCGSAIDSVVLGKRDFRFMSRHLLELNGAQVEQRSSGILIATGTGSTGWFSSAGSYLGPQDRSFDRSAPLLRFLLREPQISVVEVDGERQAVLPPFVEGSINEGDVLKITSLNGDDGIASRDSLDELPFSRDSVAEISLNPERLKVVSFGESNARA
jgi:NAD kinase